MPELPVSCLELESGGWVVVFLDPDGQPDTWRMTTVDKIVHHSRDYQ
jgi:hypothetical protein